MCQTSFAYGQVSFNYFMHIYTHNTAKNRLLKSLLQFIFIYVHTTCSEQNVVFLCIKRIILQLKPSAVFFSPSAAIYDVVYLCVLENLWSRSNHLENKNGNFLFCFYTIVQSCKVIPQSTNNPISKTVFIWWKHLKMIRFFLKETDYTMILCYKYAYYV